MLTRGGKGGSDCTLYSEADTCSLRGGFRCQDYSAWEKKRRRRGGELLPQFMSLGLFVMAAKREREEDRQAARED